MVFGGRIGTLAGVNGPDVAGAASPAAAGDAPPSRSRIDGGIPLVAIGFLALLGAELVLVLTIPGTNYTGADGKAAQAIILATLEFAKPFYISNLNSAGRPGLADDAHERLGQPGLLAVCLLRQAGSGRDLRPRGSRLLCLGRLRDGTLLRCAATAEHRRRAAEPHAVWARCARPRFCGGLRLHPGIGR